MINVTVIGFGYVGSALSLLLLNSHHALRLNIMEPNPESEGAFLDLAHGMPLYHEKELHVNDEDLFLAADFVFYAAGAPNVHGESRLSRAQQNVQLSQQIFEHRTFVNSPYIIVITNPVDIVSHAVWQFSGLPPNRVLGTGTFLDSIRLDYYLSTLSDYHPEDFDALVVGEHGASQVAVFSMSTVNGQPLVGHPDFAPAVLAEAQKLTENAAYQIRETQSGTTYGVSKCAKVMLDYLLDSEAHTVSLSVRTNDYYRKLLELNHDIYIGIPVTIGKGLVTLNNALELLPEELDAYRQSAALLAQIIEA